MREHLSVRNFGPIREAEIDVRDITIFVGPQATGKSLAAQLLYFLRRIERLVFANLTDKDAELNEVVLSTLGWWLGNKISAYTTNNTSIAWWSTEVLNGEPQEIVWNNSGVQLNQSLTERIRLQKDFPEAEVYIPAGRTLYSFLPPYSLLSRVLASRDWPGYILTFYETLGRTLDWLNRNHLPKDTKEVAFLRSRIDTIIKGRLKYGPDSISLQIADENFTPTTIAADQMEIWPFWAIVESGLKSKRLASARIYFEEPEAHLHPQAQRNIMEMVAYLIHRDTQVLLTTHSPYILYAINNFLMIKRVLDAGHKLPAGVSAEVALSPEQVAAYRFGSDSKVHNIMDAEVGLIDEDELDQVADDLGFIFTDLQELLAAEA